jgi:DNA polymerase III subunit chi
MGKAVFYHLTASPAEDLLGTVLGRALGQGWRVMIRGTDAERLNWWDERLWLGPEQGFLPHGLESAPHAADQPVLLGQGAPSNGAQGVLLIDGAATEAAEVSALERVWVVFEGADEAAVAGARDLWKRLAAGGAALEYWSDEGGRWVKKSERAAG